MSTPTLFAASHHGPPGAPVLVILHGLLGSSRNWGLVTKALAERVTVHALDLPDHGQSPHLESFSFQSMSEAVLEWMDSVGLSTVHLLGHSLGGKVAMYLADKNPERLESLIVADIAPKDYEPHSQEILAAMSELDLSSISSRKEAEEALSITIPEMGMRKFVLTNLLRTPDGFRWQVNLDSILRALPEISSNPMQGKTGYSGRTLILRGETSNFIKPEDEHLFHKYFPDSSLETVPNAGHNVHFDNLSAFTEILLRHLNV